MGKYIVLYHTPKSAMAAMANVTPEDMKKEMEAWMAWAAGCGDSLADMGEPLGGGRTLTKSGSTPSDRGFTAYSILEADDMEAAQALLAGHPHLEWQAGCEIEVHEAMRNC